MILAMTTTVEFANPPVRHDLGVISGCHSGLRPSFWMFPSYILAAPLVSGEVRMLEGDTAASVGWPGGVGLLLLHACAVQVVVASPWTPRQEVCLETHLSSILSGSVSLAMLEMAPLTAPTVATTNQAMGELGR